MLVNQDVLAEIKSIVAKYRDNAILSVENELDLMYWHIGKWIFAEKRFGKDTKEFRK